MGAEEGEEGEGREEGAVVVRLEGLAYDVDVWRGCVLVRNLSGLGSLGRQVGK